MRTSSGCSASAFACRSCAAAYFFCNRISFFSLRACSRLRFAIVCCRFAFDAIGRCLAFLKLGDSEARKAPPDSQGTDPS